MPGARICWRPGTPLCVLSFLSSFACAAKSSHGRNWHRNCRASCGSSWRRSMGLSRRGLILPLLQISSLRILRTDNPVSEPGSEAFYSGALERIRRFMMVIGAAATVAAWIRFGGRVGLGMAFGGGGGSFYFFFVL